MQGCPVHLGGARPWDPGGRSLREQIFEAKRPVEANKKDAAGTNAHNETRTWPPEESVREHHHEKPVTHLVPIHHRPILPSRSPPVFRFDAHREGAASSWEMKRRCTRHRTQGHKA